MPSDPPLTGLRVLELAGLAPGPFCGLLLSSFGASVLRIDRPSPNAAPTPDQLTTYKSSIALDLKSPSSISILHSLLSSADILIDPFRPGVLEKLHLSPHSLLAQNPRLIIVRLTGFRRDGKYASMAGHDINYLAVSGVLSMLGPSKDTPPVPPGNILGDFAGGGATAFMGVLLALLHRERTGKGQVVEANMVDGVSFLSMMPRLAMKSSRWNRPRGENLLDGGCPYYGCYKTRDEKWVSVGALEPQFFVKLLEGLGVRVEEVLENGKGDREDRKHWEKMRRVFEERFRMKTRKEWEGVFDGTDACVAPVLEMGELERNGFEQRPIVGLSESPSRKVEAQWEGTAMRPGEGGEEVLKSWMGWQSGKDYEVVNGAVVAKTKSKL